MRFGFGERWEAETTPSVHYPMDIGDHHSMSCRIWNVTCHIGSRRAWNYYALRCESLPSFSAGVAQADRRASSQISCAVFESADDARAYCGRLSGPMAPRQIASRIRPELCLRLSEDPTVTAIP